MPRWSNGEGDGVRRASTGRPGVGSGSGAADGAANGVADGVAAWNARLLALLDPAELTIAPCARCAGSRFGRWGTTRRGLQRWRCRDCGRTCTAATGTALAHVHSLDKLRLVAADMLAPAPRSCRALAAALDLDRMTVWRWRRLIAAAWADLAAAGLAVAAGSGTVILRESRKASREWVRHRRDPARHPAPDRLRWIDYRQQRLPLPEPLSRYRVSVTLGSGADDNAATLGSAVTIPPRASAGTRRDERARDTGPAAPATLLADAFKRFLAPFTGPATRHLSTYLAWFAARRATAA